jgi:hypothetical protein
LAAEEVEWGVAEVGIPGAEPKIHR